MNHDQRPTIIDAHFYDGAGSMLRSFLPIKDGNTSIMSNYYQLVFLLPNLHDQ